MQNLTGQTITAKSGNTYTLSEIVGSGAQGVVYKEKSEKYMVKLYFPNYTSSLDKEILEKLSFVKNVKKPRNFVEIRDFIDTPYIGYVMDRVIDHKPLNIYLIPDRTMEFRDWYNLDQGFRGRLFIGYIIAKAFRALSEENLSYCDISGNNILVKLKDRELSVRMIDIDNIYIAGNGTSSVLGTPRYIAPEVINKTKNPDVFSDNYSLAVILFELLRIGHPYVSEEIEDGTPEDEEAAYAGETDYVSASEGNMLPETFAFTDKLKELFEKCFVKGKENRMDRPSAKEFEFALLEACNKVIKCPSCGAWHYAKKIEQKYVCPWCDSESKPDAFLTFYDRFFDVNSDIKSSEIKPSSGDKDKKGISTYILREGQNIIHSPYVLRTINNTEDRYFTIAKDTSGYHAYNEFNKDNIYIRKFQSCDIINIGHKKAEPLVSGDEIFFDAPDNKKRSIKNSGKEYKMIRTAVFAEVKQ
jgi:serine/threonine protein kinase